MGLLLGKTIVFTGKMQHARAELASMAADAGAIVKDAVKAGLDYLVIADPCSNSVKAKNARSLGVKLISEDELFEMMFAND